MKSSTQPTDILHSFYKTLVDYSVQAQRDEEPIYAQVNKAKKKPPSGFKQASRHRSQSNVSSSNPCVTKDFDDSISFVGDDTKDGSDFNRYGVDFFIGLEAFTF